MTKITLVLDFNGVCGLFSDGEIKLRIVNMVNGTINEVEQDRIMTEIQQFEEVKTIFV